MSNLFDNSGDDEFSLFGSAGAARETVQDASEVKAKGFGLAAGVFSGAKRLKNQIPSAKIKEIPKPQKPALPEMPLTGTPDPVHDGFPPADDFSLFSLDAPSQPAASAGFTQTVPAPARTKPIREKKVSSAPKAAPAAVQPEDQFSLAGTVSAPAAESAKKTKPAKSIPVPVIAGAAAAVIITALLVTLPFVLLKKQNSGKKLVMGAITEAEVGDFKSEPTANSSDSTAGSSAVETEDSSAYALDPEVLSMQSPDSLDRFIREIMEYFYADGEEIPQTLKDRIIFYTDQFTTGIGRKSTAAILRRTDEYFPFINHTFQQNHIPEVLRYVAMQESFLNPNAESHVGAAGMWQFMPATGRIYGLVVDGDTDERKDWRLATEAAAKYFRKLLVLFGKGDGVLLAIASYNAGEGKIQKALQNVEDPLLHRNFTYLYRTSTLLAKETREYVPQVMARAIIDQHPEYFGFPPHAAE